MLFGWGEGRVEGTYTLKSKMAQAEAKTLRLGLCVECMEQKPETEALGFYGEVVYGHFFLCRLSDGDASRLDK